MPPKTVDIAPARKSGKTGEMALRPILLALAITLLATPALAARLSLGIFESWGAFRDDQPKRCYAIAEAEENGARGQYKPYFTVSSWPDRGIRGQVHVRLSRQRGANAAVALIIADQRYNLVASKTDAWAADQRGDAAIIAAIRGARGLAVQSTDANGNRFVDRYSLSGAASAIDAARLGCAR